MPHQLCGCCVGPDAKTTFLIATTLWLQHVVWQIIFASQSSHWRQHTMMMTPSVDYVILCTNIRRLNAYRSLFLSLPLPLLYTFTVCAWVLLSQMWRLLRELVIIVRIIWITQRNDKMKKKETATSIWMSNSCHRNRTIEHRNRRWNGKMLHTAIALFHCTRKYIFAKQQKKNEERNESQSHRIGNGKCATTADDND